MISKLYIINIGGETVKKAFYNKYSQRTYFNKVLTL